MLVTNCLQLRLTTLEIQIWAVFITIGMAVINALSEEFLSVSELIIINLTVILFIIFGEFILMKFSYNKVHPLAEDINRRIVLQLEYSDGNIKKIIDDEIKKQEKNLNINVKTFKIFRIDKNLNIITIHVYYYTIKPIFYIFSYCST